jgi:2-polyprenyl-3-methyl-5-hydroxy-6-metoxy-1,4-benzoquinol methylase
MQYDNVKRSLGTVFNRNPFLRILFYKLLDLLLLRTWHIHRQLRLFKRSQPMEHVLDAGSGFGQYSWFISSLDPSCKITAVDVKEEQIADCTAFFAQMKRLQHVSFQIADLTGFVDENAYDLILSVDVMEHIDNDTGVFRNFFRSLKKGGMLLISTPSDQGGSDVHDHDESSFIEEHVRDGYAISDISNKLASAGFTRIDAAYAYGTPGKISWKLSMKYPMLMLGASKIFFIMLPIYYLLVFPFCILLNCLDVRMKHASGTGLIVKAWKE